MNKDELNEEINARLRYIDLMLDMMIATGDEKAKNNEKKQ